MKWLAKRRREVLRKWRDNELTMAEASAELTNSGLSSEQAWDLLSKA